MPAIKDISRISEKWMKRAPEAQDDYARGVQDTTKDWAANTVAANANYKAGITASLAADSFMKGVRRAGNEKWKRNTIEKGTARWAQGIAGSGDAYARGFQPFHDVIKNTQLQPRGPRGSEANYQRSKQMGQALNKARLNMASA